VKTSCDQVRERLSALLDGELAEAQEREVSAHLEDCAPCRRELALLEQLDGALGGLTLSAPGGLAEKVLARLQPRRRYWWRNLALAASLVFGIILGGALARDFYISPGTGGSGEDLALEEFHDFPQGSMGAMMVSYEENGK
jgi:anti-sigma factor RsiW